MSSMAYLTSSKTPVHTQVDIELDVDIEMVERRSSIRTIPCPEAVERDDEASWSDWVTLSGMSPLTRQ